MSIVARAVGFLERLIRAPKRPVCPRCGGGVWQRHGFYYRGRRCLDRLEPAVPIQRYRCLAPHCGRTWAEQPPWLSPGRWYGRDVIRKSLDLCLDATSSWRELAEVLRAEIAGTGRALVWAPWRRPSEDARCARLAHTTLWRWFEAAAERAERPERRVDRYLGLFSGILATDETWGWVKGLVEGVGRKVEFGIQALVDGRSRVVFHLGRLRGQSEEALRVGLEKLAELGVPLERLAVWLSDGLLTYPAVLAMLDLDDRPRQRSVFQLWRNVLGPIAGFGAQRGEPAAKALREAVHAVWDASSERAAVGALFALVRTYGEDPLAQPVVRVVRSSFGDASYHLKGAVSGLARTSGVVEWLWRRFKRRMRLVQVFMGPESPERFLALFELYVNFHRYQHRKERKRRYPYPGQCPLEIAGQSLKVRAQGYEVTASWLDALAI
jgi:transposase-like protein